MASPLPPLTLAWGQLCVASVILAPVVAVKSQPWESATWSWPAITSIVALATLCTAIRFLVYYRLLGTAGATNTSLVGFLIPASSLLLGFMILGERLTTTQVAGMLLIAAGLAAIDGRLFRLLRATARWGPPSPGEILARQETVSGARIAGQVSSPLAQFAEDRFDVQDGRAVDGFEVTDRDRGFLHRLDRDGVQADRVGAIG